MIKPENERTADEDGKGNSGIKPEIPTGIDENCSPTEVNLEKLESNDLKHVALVSHSCNAVLPRDA